MSNTPTCLDSFIDGKPDNAGASWGNCSATYKARGTLHSCSVGSVELFSYGLRIAYHEILSDGRYVMLCQPLGIPSGISVTTTKHIRAFERTIDADPAYQYFTSVGTYGGWRFNPEQRLQSYQWE